MTQLPKSLLIAFFSVALVVPAAVAQQSAKSSDSSMSSKSSAGMSAADSKFIKQAAAGGLAEVELGQLAEQKAASEDVKNFGRRMVNDHSKANDQLKQVAAEEHVDLPTEPSAKDRATKDRLEKLSGQEFDRAYMRDIITDHKTDVAEFEHESKMAKDPAVKNFAATTLPVLQSHLKEAEKIARMQKAAGSSAKSKSGE